MNLHKITTGPLKVKSAMLIVGLALAAGTAFDLLVRNDPPGLGLVLFAGLVVASVVLVRRPQRIETYALLGASWVLASWTMIRSADYLVAIDICAALLLLSAAGTSEVFSAPIWMLRIRDHVRAWLAQLGEVCAGAVRPATTVIRARTNLRIGGALPYLRGFILAVPVFLGFSVLLSSADSMFSNFLGGIVPSFDFAIGATAAHLIWIFVIAWMAAGFYVFIAQSFNRPLVRDQRRTLRLGYIEAIIVLGSVTALFALFVIFQFKYLFSGAEQIDLPGVTYAQYARAGFFQLLAVATLTAGLVWFALQSFGDTLEGGQRTAFRVICAVMIALSTVILASGLKRLGLYEEAYGFTRLRLLSHIFSFLVGGVLVLLLAQLFRQSRHLFVAGTVVLGFIAVIALNTINPDAYIANQNMDRTQFTEDGELDYIRNLSADALPTVIDRYVSRPPNRKVAKQIDAWACIALDQERRWQGWNRDFSRAERACARSGLSTFTVPRCCVS